MGLFKRKKEKVLDLSDNPYLPKKNTEVVAGPASQESDLGFLGSLASASSQETSSSTYTPNDYSSNTSSDVLDKIERLHRKIDHLVERIELMERKIERAEGRLS